MDAKVSQLSIPLMSQPYLDHRLWQIWPSNEEVAMRSTTLALLMRLFSLLLRIASLLISLSWWKTKFTRGFIFSYIELGESRLRYFSDAQSPLYEEIQTLRRGDRSILLRASIIS